LLRKALSVLWSSVARNYLYRPERHYMRGPGPKSLEMIGTKLRVESESITQEPLPERWLALMHSLNDWEEERLRPGEAETEPREAKTPRAPQLERVEMARGDRAPREHARPLRR
jgi:hypothetical protein